MGQEHSGRIQRHRLAWLARFVCNLRSRRSAGNTLLKEVKARYKAVCWPDPVLRMLRQANNNKHGPNMMKKTLSTLLICGSALTASCANMNGMHEQSIVTESVRVNAPAADVWQLVGEFNDLKRWHPAVKISKQVSDQRYLTLQDDTEMVEQETARDDSGMSYSYRIVSSPLPVAAYNATISVMAVGASQSEVTWRSSFDAKGVSKAEAEATIRGVYRAGLDHLQQMYR